MSSKDTGTGAWGASKDQSGGGSAWGSSGGGSGNKCPKSGCVGDVSQCPGQKNKTCGAGGGGGSGSAWGSSEKKK